MPVVAVGLDLAKTVFQAHGVDDAGQTVLRRRLGRSELLAFFAKLIADRRRRRVTQLRLQDVAHVTAPDAVNEILAQEVGSPIVVSLSVHGWMAVSLEFGARQAAIGAAVGVDQPEADVAADASFVDEFETDPGVIPRIRERAAESSDACRR